jgi:hypothetical protein
MATLLSVKAMAVAKSLDKTGFQYTDHTDNRDSSEFYGKFRLIREFRVPALSDLP